MSDLETIAGQIIHGLGGTTIETVQSKMYAFYAVGDGILGLVYGLDIGIGRVYTLMGKATAVPIMQNLGSWSWTFWVRAPLAQWTLTEKVNARRLAR